ncbi:hypothetical protein QJQ45_003873 [Haematococcus lacustris]|nr:hypothetical protein QJQ45_003873 [Haematococcus lacustris]
MVVVVVVVVVVVGCQAAGVLSLCSGEGLAACQRAMITMRQTISYDYIAHCPPTDIAAPVVTQPPQAIDVAKACKAVLTKVNSMLDTPSNTLAATQQQTRHADGYISQMDRLTQLLDHLQEVGTHPWIWWVLAPAAAACKVDANFDTTAWPAPGTDYVFDMVMGLKQRRREAIRYEVARLASKLEVLSAGRQEL